ncbi:22489_t:CDS:2, partial [Gigaspora margarita]
ITFGVVAKDAIRDPLELPLESPLFRSSDFEARETILTFLEVVGRALLESP